MWFWIIVTAVVIGGLLGLISSNGDSSEAANGAMAGGCMAASCLVRLAIAAIGILLILWLFGAIFG